MVCTVESTTHSYTPVSKPMWREVVIHGVKKWQRQTRLQCRNCHRLNVITTLVDRAEYV